MPFIDIYEPPKTGPGYPSEANVLLDTLLEQIATTETRPELLDLFRSIESDNIRTAESDAKAKGVYQFKNKSVDTAKNRAIELGIDKSYVNLIPNDPRQWTDDEADVMALANLFNQIKDYKGKVDNILIQAFGGDRQSMQDAYELHHTSLSDKGTQERLDEKIPIIGPLNQYNYGEKYKYRK